VRGQGEYLWWVIERLPLLRIRGIISVEKARGLLAACSWLIGRRVRDMC